MKKVIQILLFLITIIIIIIFYQKYFISEQNTEVKESVNQTQSQSESSKNNLIKNLRYDLNLQDNTKYMIIANESEIFYDKDAEMVNMTNVKAKFIDVKVIETPAGKFEAEHIQYYEKDNSLWLEMWCTNDIDRVMLKMYYPIYDSYYVLNELNRR